MSGDLANIFSRKMRAAGIGAAPVARQIVANDGECAALAEVFRLPGMAELSGDFILTSAKTHGGVIDAELRLRARVMQTCVITLEPFDTVVQEIAQLRFVPATNLHEDAEIAELSPEALEAPDEIPYAGEVIDLGATLAEQLALALDPYPRKPGAELPAAAGGSAGNPFAVLAERNKPANDPE